MGNKRPKSNKELEHFLETLELLEPNKYEVLGKYLNADTYLLMKHNECDKTCQERAFCCLCVVHFCPP